MAPRPNSQSEPSSRRAISKSWKSAAAFGESGPSDSSNPARSRQAKQVRFAPSGSPHTEQFVADAGSIEIDRLLLYENAQQLAQFSIHFGFGIHRAPDLRPEHLAVTGAQTGNVTANG